MEYGSLDISNIVEQMETVLFNPKNETKKKLQKQYLHDKPLMFQEKLKMREENKNITNREALKEKIHEIHNFMRNNGAGYGMNALKIFNILYGLKKIEDNGLLDQFNFQNCKFSDLLVLANNNQDEQLVHIIYNDLLDTINQHEQLRNIMFYEFPDNLKGNVFVYLVKEIEKIANIEKSAMYCCQEKFMNILLAGMNPPSVNWELISQTVTLSILSSIKSSQKSIQITHYQPWSTCLEGLVDLPLGSSITSINITASIGNKN